MREFVYAFQNPVEYAFNSFQVFRNTETKASSRRSANGVYATKDVFAVLPTGCGKF